MPKNCFGALRMHLTTIKWLRGHSSCTNKEGDRCWLISINAVFQRCFSQGFNGLLFRRFPNGFCLRYCSSGRTTNPSSNSKGPIPGPYHRKGECRKDIHITKSLWHNEESHYLPWKGKGEGTWSKIYVCKSDLAADQIQLEPSMNVSVDCTSFSLPLNNEPARRAHHRWRTCVLQSRGLRFSRLPRNRVR